jgi:amino acid adenylation domain-containing protein
MAPEKTVEPPRPELSAAKRALIEARLRGQVRSSGIVPRAHRDGAPLSFAQERLWFIDRLEPGSATYNIPAALRLTGALDVVALERALGEIVRRHEALRTVFSEVDGLPVQVISPFGGFALPVEDLSGLGEADREAAAGRRTSEEARRGFDLSAGPLFRASLLRLGAEDHVLLITMHHIVSDGWSGGVLFREMWALYEAYRAGRESPLPELPVQYADYAVWQREQLAGEALERHLSYWRERLAGAPELLELPTDHPRPAVQTFRGATVPVELSPELLERLQALGRSEGATLYMTVLAAFQVLLSKYSGSDDIVVGSPIAGRTRKEIKELIGLFVNTLVLRTDLSGDPSFREVLRRAREATLGAYEHQEMPFEKLVAELKPERSLSHSPLFQVVFTLESAGGGEGTLAGLEVSGAGAELASAKFDLSLMLKATAQGVRGGLNYSTDLFERGTVERMLGHLGRVLEQVAADPDVRLSRLELLGGVERALVLEAWNRTERPYPPGVCMHELFEAQVERTPGAVAVSFQGERVTYAELNARANRLAHHLRALGVGPEVRVAVCINRGVDTLVALLAVLKAGGGYVPLDPGNPDDRLRYLLADSAPAVLLTGGPIAARLAGAGVPLVDLGDLGAWDAYPASDPGRAEVGVGPEHLAYVIYTSGSTGRPKGVLVQHGSFVNLLAVTRAAFGVGPGDVMPALASSAFDMSLFEIPLPLISGAEVRLVPPLRVMEARALLDDIADATLLCTVPAVMREIVKVERQGPRLARLRATFVGGEQVPADLLAEMSAAFPAARTHVIYGPTETTILTSTHEVPGDGAVAGHPIGRPLGNVRLYVCDALGEPQPLGVAGELLIGGMGVARGYLGRPALTAERFVPDPFSTVPGARLYRSGDRVRWKESGVVDFLGRTDFQVKIRGFRIEPGEIEARLREHPAVRQAVVLAREDFPGKKLLVAYVVGEAAADALKAHLAASLPAYMVPAAYVRLEALPLTSNGKVDRRALPVPGAAAFARRGPEPPHTMTERVLAEIWAEVLGVKQVGRRDNFFDLGGHSMLAVQLVARVREALNPAATVTDVFTHPTLYELAARLQGAGEWYGTNHAIPLRETGSERPLFVSHDGVGIVFYGQILRPHLDPEIPVYALPGPLNDTDELASLDDLVTRLVRMMTEVQPEGPYRVTGWSAGGVFAYAVAERLIRTGRAVEFVGLLDSYSPTRGKKQDPPRERQFKVLELLARDCGVAPATPEALQVLREETEGLDLPAFIAACKARGLLPETLTVARAEQVDSRIALLKRSLAEYVPPPLPVPVYIFASDDAADNPRRGWEDMPGGAPFRVERVPGTHHTMWKKGNVEVVGATISRAIRASAAGGGGRSEKEWPHTESAE